jgi:hypothetical protein
LFHNSSGILQPSSFLSTPMALTTSYWLIPFR